MMCEITRFPLSVSLSAHLVAIIKSFTAILRKKNGGNLRICFPYFVFKSIKAREELLKQYKNGGCFLSLVVRSTSYLPHGSVGVGWCRVCR